MTGMVTFVVLVVDPGFDFGQKVIARVMQTCALGPYLNEHRLTFVQALPQARGLLVRVGAGGGAGGAVTQFFQQDAFEIIKRLQALRGSYGMQRVAHHGEQCFKGGAFWQQLMTQATDHGNGLRDQRVLLGGPYLGALRTIQGHDS
jgi:hypothetical protein